MKSVTVFGLSVLVLGCAAASSSATPILYNITDGQTAATVADFTAAGVTQSLAGTPDSNVLTDVGSQAASLSGIGVGFGGGWGYWGPGDDWGGSTNAVYQMTQIANPGATLDESITGLSSSPSYALTPNTSYVLYFFANNQFGGPSTITATYGTQTQTFTNQTDEVPAIFDFTTGSVVTDAMDITNSTVSGTYPADASFAIVPAASTPEPATLGLLGLTVTACLVRRRPRAEIPLYF